MTTNRDLNPTKEAIAAMSIYSSEYAAQPSGSMTFWDSLPESKQRLCRELVDRILLAPERSEVRVQVLGRGR